jgi:hypothetical protein
MNETGFTVLNALLGLLYLAIFIALLYLGYWFARTMLRKK